MDEGAKIVMEDRQRERDRFLYAAIFHSNLTLAGSEFQLVGELVRQQRTLRFQL